VVIALVGGFLLLQRPNRPNFGFNVLHDRIPLFVILSDDPPPAGSRGPWIW
jgi:polyferredoxin